MSTSVLLFVAAALAGAPPEAMAEIGRVEVTVRLYGVGLSAPSTERALATAASVLAPAGVVVSWVRCDPRDAVKPIDCDRPPDVDDLIVRLVRAGLPEGYRGELPLGDALIDTHRCVGVIGTVYVDRVLWLAAAVPTAPAVVLGRVIAHEVGHLLAGSSVHQERGGVMRPRWTRAELRRGRRSDWQLAGADAREVAARRLALLAGSALLDGRCGPAPVRPSVNGDPH